MNKDIQNDLCAVRMADHYGVPASDVSLIAVCSGTSPDVGNRTTSEQEDLLR